MRRLNTKIAAAALTAVLALSGSMAASQTAWGEEALYGGVDTVISDEDGAGVPADDKSNTERLESNINIAGDQEEPANLDTEGTVEPNAQADIDNAETVIEPDENGYIAYSKSGWGIDASGHCNIPAGTTEVPDSEFSMITDLISVFIPDTVTTIKDSAFNRCNNLKSVYIPDSVETVGDYAFYYCSSLTSLRVPTTLISIGTGGFSETGLRYYSQIQGIPPKQMELLTRGSGNILSPGSVMSDYPALPKYLTGQYTVRFVDEEGAEIQPAATFEDTWTAAQSYEPTQKPNAEDYEFVSCTFDEETYTFTYSYLTLVPQVLPVELPNTGGKGIAMLLVAGGLLFAIAFGVPALYRKYKTKKSSESVITTDDGSNVVMEGEEVLVGTETPTPHGTHQKDR